MQGRHDRALHTAQEALAISRAIGDKNGEAGCHIAVGIHSQNLGRLDRAHQSFARALNMISDQHDPYLYVSAMLNIAGIHMVRGHFDECRKNITVIEKEAQRLGNVYLVVNSLNLKAEYMIHVDQGGKYRRVLRKSIRISEAYRLVPEHIVAVSLWVRAIVQRGEDLSCARTLLRKCDRLTCRYPKPDALVYQLPAQIEYYCARSDTNRAQQKAQQLLAMVRRNNNGMLLPRAYYYMALVRRRMGRPPGSFLKKAERLAGNSGMKPLLHRIAALKKDSP
jgi:tetratricopeptide (TPR) repeat protein